MELNKILLGNNTVKLDVSGRLDAYWSGHLEKEIEEILHSDIYDIRLNLEKIDYISSAGIRILLKYYKKLKKINGSFAIIALSENARATIELSGLEQLLNTKLSDENIKQTADTKDDNEFYSIEFLEKKQTEKLTLELIGNAELPLDHNSPVINNYNFTDNMLGLGIGELSGSAENDKNKAGEFLAVYGAAAYLPTDGSNTPDYIIESNNLIPQINIIYGATVTGALQKQFRFNSKTKERQIQLSEILEICSRNSNTEQTAVLIVAETSGLVGAALRSDPRNNKQPVFFEFPDIRKKLSFSSDPMFKKYLTITAGIIGTDNSDLKLKKILRKVKTGNKLLMHIHSLAFPYMQLAKGALDYKKIIKDIFNANAPEGLLHLLTDDREISGIGESEFTRGVCWFGEIEKFKD